MGLLSTFESVEGRARWKAFIHAARRHTRDAPAIFLSFDMKRPSLASFMAAQTFAMFVAKLRSRFDPYVAPDAASIRRLIHARRIDATDQLIASASIEDRTLTVWSCEPKRYEIPISEIPALGTLGAETLKKLEVSSSGSRIHWEDGDVDINLDTIRAVVDPAVRQAHEAEARQETAVYFRKFEMSSLCNSDRSWWWMMTKSSWTCSNGSCSAKDLKSFRHHPARRL